MLIVKPVLSGVVINPTSLVTGVLVSMKTLLRSPAIPRPSPTSFFYHFFHCYDGETGGGSIFGITRLPGVIEAEREFMVEMVDSLYKSLK